ncbi:hypothetical protein [Eikenella sp. Marseille-P7795]|uniref:hypothetical protein n=1 Tax=Eikenella sp. Marseille-P7795 TaxID=2866577 RepID=UPI001CE441C7|nr:hypothetical protein [Eikenella sp. Marseille-P7795]
MAGLSGRLPETNPAGFQVAQAWQTAEKALSFAAQHPLSINIKKRIAKWQTSPSAAPPPTPWAACPPPANKKGYLKTV